MSNAMQKESDLRELYLKMTEDPMYDPALHGALLSLIPKVWDSDRWGEPMNTSHQSIAYNLRLCALTCELFSAADKCEEVSSCD